MLVVLLLLFLLPGCENSTKNKNITEVQVIGDERIKELYPSWVLLKKEPINLNGNNFEVIGLGRMKNQYTADIRLTVLKYINNQWLEVWHIPKDLESECLRENTLRENPSNNLKDLVIVDDNGSALIVANVLVGGNHGVTQVVAFTINLVKDEYALRLFDSSGLMKISKDGKYVLVEGRGEYGVHKLYLENGEFKEGIIARSDTSLSDSTNAKFILSDSDKLIYPSESSSITMRVGQTITFVPANTKTKQVFDSGEIEIYTDSWNDPPLSICEANKINSGNSYTFDKAGAFHFLLISNKSKQYMNSKNIEPTFTIVVTP